MLCLGVWMNQKVSSLSNKKVNYPMRMASLILQTDSMQPVKKEREK